jgi:hypothetical protein
LRGLLGARMSNDTNNIPTGTYSMEEINEAIKLYVLLKQKVDSLNIAKIAPLIGVNIKETSKTK